MSYRYISANDVVDIVDIETQNKINEMDCVYIDGIKPHNQHFNLADHDKRINDEVIDRFMNLCDAYCHFNKDKHPANGYVISRASLLDIAEKLKGE